VNVKPVTKKNQKSQKKSKMIDYAIRQIDSKSANAMVVESHYLHRRASTMFAYGLFDGEEMIGCVIYGKPASPSLCVGVCGTEESSKVLELTRLWIKDGTPKNTESYLIGRSLRLLPKEKDIIVSYAEIGAGHIGIVYQATNWIYTGMSDRHVEWRLDGKSGSHSRHLFDEHGGVNGAKAFYGDRLQRHERPRKHRYVFFNTNSKWRKKELLAKLKYQVKPYPKLGDKTE
jgi:hypothetical protein